jgi:hypothetical protein
MSHGRRFGAGLEIDRGRWGIFGERFGIFATPVTLAELGDDGVAGIAGVGRIHGVIARATIAVVLVSGTVAPIGIEGAFGIFAFEVGVGIGPAGGEGGSGLFVADFGVVFVGLANPRAIALGEVVGILFDFLFGEPAGGGEVGGAGGNGLAELDALLLIHIFGDRPLGLEGAGGTAVFLDGTEGLAVGAGEDFSDGFRDAGVLLRGGWTDGNRAGQGVSGDLATVRKSAGLGGVERAGEKALGDLGDDELDGGVVIEEGHDDFGALFRALRPAVVLMGVAEVVAAEGDGVALDSVDAEGAAAAGLFGRFGRRCVGGRHRTSFLKTELRAPGCGQRKSLAGGEAVSAELSLVTG